MPDKLCKYCSRGLDQLEACNCRDWTMNVPYMKCNTCGEFGHAACGMAANGIGDLNSTEKGSAARYNADKPRLSHIPMWSLYGEAKVWEYGAKKYKAHNWRKGMGWSYAYDSMMRHLTAWQAGQDNDPESGLPHLDHAASNLRMLLVFRETYPEGDDRAPKEFSPKEYQNGSGKD